MISSDQFNSAGSALNQDELLASDIGGAAPLDIELEDLLDDQPIVLRQILIVVLVLLVMMFDGMDLQILGLAAPNLLKDWHIAKSLLGPAFATTVIGMALGALAGGWFGDRRGRKLTLILALCLIGVASLACGLTRNVFQLAFCRFVCGIGGGACFPCATTLIAEWLPRRRKSLAVGIVTIGIPLGGMLGAVLVIVTMPRGGWREAFLVGGFLPLLLALAAQAVMPESPSWLAARGDRQDRLKALIGIVWPQALIPQGRLVSTDRSLSTGRQTILGPQDRRTSLGLWLAFYMNVLATSGIVTWGAILLTGMGFAMSFAVTAVFAVNFVAALTMLGCSLLANRLGTRALFLAASACSVVLILLVCAIYFVSPKSDGIAVGLVAAGGFLFMNQSVLYIIASQAYPVEKRSTGVGFASLASRFGSTTSALLGGLVLSLATPLYFLFGLTGAALIAAVGALIINRHVAPLRVRTAIAQT